jgi:hypothetical protein
MPEDSASDPRYQTMHQNTGEETMRRTITTIAASLALALGLAACGGGQIPTTASHPATSTTTSSSPTTETPTPSEPTEDLPTELKFGQTWEYENGLQVTVGAPKTFTPSDYAETGTQKYNVKFKVTLTNKTGQRFSASSCLVDVESGGVEAEEIFDSERGLNGAPETAVLAGRSTTYYVGFNVKNPKDVVLQIAPDFEYEEAIFTS